jgi:3-deoxy-D-manno-octulosonate 8-phosphate phosphatase (KDO 8-P phosphatase)
VVTESLDQRCAAIEMLILDVDGVLTDGRIIYSDAGAELKAFHVRDGSGLKLWLQLGKRAGIITGRSSPVVERRAKELGLTEVVQGAEDKRIAYERMLTDHGLDARCVAYVGDDLPDLPLMLMSGLAIAVVDACAEVKATAHHVTLAKGGRGAVREAIELILQVQGRWSDVVARFGGR